MVRWAIVYLYSCWNFHLLLHPLHVSVLIVVHELEHVVQLGRRKNRNAKDKDCPVGQTVRGLKIVSQHFQLSLPTSLLLESGISGPVGAIALHSSAECWKGGSCGLSSKLGTCNLGLQLGTSQGAQWPGTAWTPNLIVNWFCQSLTGPIFWQCFTKLWLMFCHWHWQWIFWDLVHTAPDTLRPQPRQTGGVLLLGPTWGMRLNFSLRSWSQQVNWEAGDIMWRERRIFYQNIQFTLVSAPSWLSIDYLHPPQVPSLEKWSRPAGNLWQL